MNDGRTLEAEKRAEGNVRQTQLYAEPSLGDVASDAAESLRLYAKKRPEVVAMWCLGIGFVLGWKLKPW